MDTSSSGTVLSDSENWSPVYQSETWPTASVVSPLLLALIMPVIVAAQTAVGVDGKVFSLAPLAHRQLEHASTTLAEGAVEFVAVSHATTQNVVVEGRAPIAAKDELVDVSAQEVVGDALQGLSLATLARLAFPETRQMEAWEKKATDAFFLSHFK